MLLLGATSLTIEGVTVFADHADPRQFWYLPAPVALARRGADKRASFTFIKYKPAAVAGGAKGGGFLTFEVNLRLDPDLERRILSKLSAFARGQPRLAVAPFDEGTVQCIALNVQGAGGTAATPAASGAFNAVEKILGASVPSLQGDNSAAFSLTLSQEGATILEQAFAEGTTPVGVIYDLKFTGMRPALEVRITADLKRVYDHFSTSLQGQYAFVQAGIDAGFEKLKQDGAIKIEVLNFTGAADQDEKEKWALDFFKDNLLRQWFEPTLTPGQLAGGAAQAESLDDVIRRGNQLRPPATPVPPRDDPQATPPAPAPLPPSPAAGTGRGAEQPGIRAPAAGGSAGAAGTAAPGTTAAAAGGTSAGTAAGGTAGASGRPSGAATATPTGTAAAAGTSTGAATGTGASGGAATGGSTSTADVSPAAGTGFPAASSQVPPAAAAGLNLRPASAPPAASSAAVAPTGPVVSFKLKAIQQEEQKKLTLEYRRAEAVQRTYAPQGFFGLLLADLNKAGHFVEVDLDDPFFRVFTVTVDAPVDFERIGLRRADVALDYGGPADPGGSKHAEFVFDPQNKDEKKLEVFMNKRRDTAYRYQVQYHFDPNSGWDGQKTEHELPPKTTEDRTLLLNPFEAIGFLEVKVLPHRIDPGVVDSTDVQLRYEDPAGWSADKIITVTADSAPQFWKLRLSNPSLRTYTYRLVHRLKNGTTREMPPVTTRATTIPVDDPFEGALDIVFVPVLDPARTRLAFVDLEYADPANNYKREQRLRITPDLAEVPLHLSVIDPAKKKFRYRVTMVGKGGQMQRGDFVETDETLLSIVE